MKKITPDRKVSQGGVAGMISAVISAWIASRFHLTALELGSIPALTGVVMSFLAAYMAPYEPRIEEIVAYVKKLVNEIPAAE